MASHHELDQHRLLPLRATKAKNASERALHALHLLLTGLFFFGGHLSEPLLAVQANFRIHHLEIFLATLADLIPDHLTLG